MNNKVVLITGASRGIGRNIAIELAKEGNYIIANYNKSEDMALSLKKEAEKNGWMLDIFKADVSKRNEVKQLIEYTLNKYKKIDVLINNAGISQSKLFTDISDDDWNNMIQTNLNSVFYLTQETVQIMIDNKEGCIINISSIWGQTGASCESHYSVTKAGVDCLTKSLAKELGPSNIRVNSIAPGIIDTDINNNLTKKEIDEIKKDIPLGKIGMVDDISKCVKWLIDDNYTTGQIIAINGGWYI